MEDFSNVEISFDELPKAEELELKGLERPFLTIKILGNVLLWGILLVALYLFNYFRNEPNAFFDKYLHYVGLAFICMLFIQVIFDVLGFRWKGYALREKDITYRTGLLFRKHTHIPFNRVQHVEVNQGVLDRIFDLAKLRVYTAGGSRSDLSIPGIKNEIALQLKSYILQKTEEDEF